MSERFEVGDPLASGVSTGAPAPPVPGDRHVRKPRAVFVAHGMGQQVPFATLDDVARGLCVTAPAKVKKTRARTIRVGCEVVQRLEIEFEKSAPPPIHVYEAYWAPLTEGVVGLWAVVRFLVTGAVNALRSGGQFDRFMFGKRRTFAIPARHIAQLFFVLLLVLALVFIGIVIAAVGVARLTFRNPGWLTPELLKDLTGTFELLLATLILGAVIAFLLVKLSALAGWIRMLTVPVGLLVSLVVLASAYVRIPLSFLFDVKMPFDAFPECGSCASATGPWLRAYVGSLLRRLHLLLQKFCLGETWVWWMLLLVASAVVLYALMRAAMSAIRREEPAEDIADTHRHVRGQWWGVAVASIPFILVLAMCGRSEVIAFTTWVVLLAVVLFVRSFLIQYLGDVAAYVSPHLVDRFFELRQKIKDRVWRAARAVYALRDDDTGDLVYDEVAIVGHSLGSVIVYDVLNRLINDDLLSQNAKHGERCDDVPIEKLGVEDRTKLLLTFGSPLDKTAFVFAMHDRGAGSERDALAASVQPLISRPRKLAWVNVWSPWDIFSGDLDFYDDDPPGETAVKDEKDPGAVTPLAAHTEYWNNPLIYKRIHEYL